MVTIETALVTTVYDGDTFLTLSGERIRLNAVCAPEVGQFGWLTAKRRLEDLILWQKVSIYPIARDTYERIIANVYVGYSDVNETMRRYGYRC